MEYTADIHYRATVAWSSLGRSSGRWIVSLTGTTFNSKARSQYTKAGSRKKEPKGGTHAINGRP